MTRGFGVVIPAYQGARTLVRSMGSLAAQHHRGALHVVVAVNDGGDETLAAAHRLAPLLRARGAVCDVVESSPGRAAALNVAERLLPHGPRLYLDQDARLSPDAIGALEQALGDDHRPRFAAPQLRIARSASAVSRAYYDAWTKLPYVRESPVTIGAYAVSVAGRERWGVFPALQSDDKFVRLCFAPSERTLVAASYEVVVPAGARALVQSRRRYLRGNRELQNNGALAPSSVDLPRHRGTVAAIARRPADWPSWAVFLAVYATAALTTPSGAGDGRP